MAEESIEFLESLKDLFSNWPVEDSRVKGIKRHLWLVWQDCGAQRFKSGVRRCIHERQSQYFPTVGEFKQYIPNAPDESAWKPSANEIVRRRLHPEDFFGDSDVRMMMKIVQDRARAGESPLSGDEMCEELLRRRAVNA